MEISQIVLTSVLTGKSTAVGTVVFTISGIR